MIYTCVSKCLTFCGIYKGAGLKLLYSLNFHFYWLEVSFSLSLAAAVTVDNFNKNCEIEKKCFL